MKLVIFMLIHQWSTGGLCSSDRTANCSMSYIVGLFASVMSNSQWRSLMFHKPVCLERFKHFVFANQWLFLIMKPEHSPAVRLHMFLWSYYLYYMGAEYSWVGTYPSLILVLTTVLISFVVAYWLWQWQWQCVHRHSKDSVVLCSDFLLIHNTAVIIWPNHLNGWPVKWIQSL